MSNLSIKELRDLSSRVSEELQEAATTPQLYQVNSRGNIANNIENYITFLNNNPLTKSRIKYNSFLERKEYDNEEYTDFIESKIKRALSSELCLTVTKSIFDDAMNNVFLENQYNPTLDYLNSLTWDGKERIETMFIDWLGAKDTPLTREMTKKWLIAAVKRIFEPGCKFDNMIVLKGPQGGGKSTICYRLAHGFYNEHINIDEPKNYVEIISRSWIVCFDELAGISRKDLSAIKSFLSKQSETVRLAFMHNPQTYKRHCIFIGSTNEENFLRDYTASIERRFWVIECTFDNTKNIVGEKFTEDVVNQIWAEAVFNYRNNKDIFLDLSSDAIQDLMLEQDKYKISNSDEILDFVRDMFDKEYILNNKNEFDNEEDFYLQYCNISTKTGEYSKMSRIPTRYVKYVLLKKYHESRTPSYIASALKDLIIYKKAIYHDRTDNCYCLVTEQYEKRKNTQDFSAEKLFA